MSRLTRCEQNLLGDTGMDHEFGSLLTGLPAGLHEEQISALLATPHLRVERIVSTGQASPPGFWCDQDWGEWVLLVAGAAAVEIEGEPAPRLLSPAITSICPHIAAIVSPGPPRPRQPSGSPCIIFLLPLGASLMEEQGCPPLPLT